MMDMEHLCRYKTCQFSLLLTFVSRGRLPLHMALLHFVLPHDSGYYYVLAYQEKLYSSIFPFPFDVPRLPPFALSVYLGVLLVEMTSI